MLCCFSKNTIRRQDILDVSLHHASQNEYTNDDYLVNITYKDTVPYVHQIHRGKVVKVYDGDTITIAAKLLHFDNSPVYRFSVRLRGIDSPEMKTKFPIEKILADKSQKALSQFILHQIVYLTDVGMDKYGRILANVYLDKVNISQWMLENGYAVPYDGTIKNIPDEWRIPIRPI
jgi:endonuclease YncB( thermonuclease family)